MEQAKEVYGKDSETAKELLSLLTDVLSSPGETFLLGKEIKPKEPLWKLTPEHLRYVIASVKERQGKGRIYNVRAYRLAALYHSTETLSSYQAAQTQIQRKAEENRRYTEEMLRTLQRMREE